MSDVSLFLLVIAAIFVIGIVGEIVFTRTGIPDVVWLIVTGIALGPVFGLVSRSDLQTIAPYFGALTLVVVLFDGGSELRLKDLSLAAGRGTLLALVGFVLSVVFVTPVVMAGVKVGILPEQWTWMQCLLVGTILGGSSSVVIMPALRKAGLSSRISNLVNLESALTDVLSVVATGACLAIATARGATLDAGTAGSMLGQSFGIGIGAGLVFGVFAVIALRGIRKSGYGYPLILGMLLVLYVIVDEAGGSAALAILAAAVVIGNGPAISKLIGLEKAARLGSSIEGVHDEMTFIIKSFFFAFLGAMLGPPWGLLLFGIFLGVVILLARLPNVYLATIKSGFSTPAKGLIAVLLPRGMAAGVLAMMPHQAGIPYTKDLPVLVFSAVFTTILLFAAGFPILKKKLPASDLAETDSKAAPAPAPASAPESAPAPASESAPAPESAPATAPAPAVSDSGVPVRSSKTAAQEPQSSASTPQGPAPVSVPEGDADQTVVDTEGPVTTPDG